MILDCQVLLSCCCCFSLKIFFGWILRKRNVPLPPPPRHTQKSLWEIIWLMSKLLVVPRPSTCYSSFCPFTQQKESSFVSRIQNKSVIFNWQPTIPLLCLFFFLSCSLRSKQREQKKLKKTSCHVLYFVIQHCGSRQLTTSKHFYCWLYICQHFSYQSSGNVRSGCCSKGERDREKKNEISSRSSQTALGLANLYEALPLSLWSSYYSWYRYKTMFYVVLRVFAFIFNEEI